MARVRVPDGKGGWQEIEGDVVSKGAQANVEKQQQAIAQRSEDDAGELTTKIWKFAQLYATENNLSKEQVVFAVALLCVNMREGYPEGKPAFDEVSAAAAAYYDRNKGR